MIFKPIRILVEIILFIILFFGITIHTTFASGYNTQFSKMDAKSDVEILLKKMNEVDWDIHGDLKYIKTNFIAKM